MSTNPVHTPDEYVELASHFLERRELDLSLACSDEALRFGAAPASVAYQRWMCFMLCGDFERAWQETDRAEAARRLRSGRRCSRRTREENLPLHLRRVWDGSPLENADVLVRCYHGLGDTIQFVRYLPLLKQRARSVALQCQRELIPLIAQLPHSDAIVSLDDDLHVSNRCIEIESMELAYAFRTTLATIPKEIPYLHLPRFARGASRSARSGAINIGMAWSSGNWNPERNIPLHHFTALKCIPRLRLFSLQRGAAAHEIAANPDLHITLTETPHGTIVNTAATILDLDLVISVDTMIAHLAGALGRPVWLLLPFRADWRWMAARSDSPWYPTMRIFRQPRPGDWQAVLRRVAAALAA